PGAVLHGQLVQPAGGPQQAGGGRDEKVAAAGRGAGAAVTSRGREPSVAERRPDGREGPPSAEVVRFRTLLTSLAFPPSAIYEATRPGEALPLPALRV